MREGHPVTLDKLTETKVSAAKLTNGGATYLLVTPQRPAMMGPYPSQIPVGRGASCSVLSMYYSACRTLMRRARSLKSCGFRPAPASSASGGNTCVSCWP